MRRRKVKTIIIELLEEEGEMSTEEIYQLVNRITFHGVTKNQLGNVLAKSPEIQKVDFVRNSINGFRRREIVWSLKKCES